jgi:hypothetical protein
MISHKWKSILHTKAVTTSLTIALIDGTHSKHCITSQISSHLINTNCIGDVIVSVLALSEVDHGFESWSGQTKD